MRIRGSIGVALWIGAISVLSTGAFMGPRQAVFAQEAGAIDGAALAELTGVTAMVEGLRDSFDAGFSQTGVPEQFMQAAAEASAAFDAAVMSRRIAAFLDSNLDEVARAEVAEFYRSPLGARILAFDAEGLALGSRPDHLSLLAEAANELEKDQERMTLTERISAAVHAEQVSEIVLEASMRAMLTGMISAQTNKSVVDPEMLEQMLQRQMPGLVARTEERVALSIAFTYRNATTDELVAYLDFLYKDSAQKFYAATYRVLADALQEASYQFGQRLAAKLAEKGI